MPKESLKKKKGIFYFMQTLEYCKGKTLHAALTQRHTIGALEAADIKFKVVASNSRLWRLVIAVYINHLNPCVSIEECFFLKELVW